MSKMNLQKLRQVCYRNESNHPVLTINLPPNDPLNRVVFTDDQDIEHTAQARAIRYNSTSGVPRMVVNYSTEEDLSRLDENERIEFNVIFGRTFHPRLEQILVEHGFHSGFLPHKDVDDIWSSRPFNLFYTVVPQGFINQIIHACYYDGRSMRKAVEFQAELNKK